MVRPGLPLPAAPRSTRSPPRAQFTGPNRSFLEYSGFLMANDCALIAQNGLTEADSQLCRGGYARGASVACDGDNRCVSVFCCVG